MAKILIVDDEPLTIEMLSTFLNLSGHEPVGALSTKQTWDRLAYEEPDAILLDIMLPDGNGLEICQQLRADPRWANTPVIIISAHTPPMTAEATRAGANAYLAKPIRLDALRVALREVGIS
ncbi:MAG TPA: response regulator [Spirillospora sp.]|nr:response regulator [Spirillospora sp.]